MRIISGSARGRKLFFPKGCVVRPAMDRVRTDIFNILGPTVVDRLVLDVFAGTGSVGLEALSRGAAGATFIEDNPRVIETLRKNLEHCGLADRARVLSGDFQKSLTLLKKSHVLFDFIFIDPPYHRDLLTPCLATIATTPLLAPSGRIIIENHKSDPLEFANTPFAITRIKKYGQTHLLFIEWRPLEPPPQS